MKKQKYLWDNTLSKTQNRLVAIAEENGAMSSESFHAEHNKKFPQKPLTPQSIDRRLREIANAEKLTRIPLMNRVYFAPKTYLTKRGKVFKGDQ